FSDHILSLAVSPIGIGSPVAAPLGSVDNAIAPMVTPSLTPRVQNVVSHVQANSEFLLWTIGTGSGGSGKTRDSEAYTGTFVECGFAVRIKSMNADRLTFDSGRLLINNKGNNLTVVTPFGELAIFADTSAIVDCGK